MTGFRRDFTAATPRGRLGRRLGVAIVAAGLLVAAPGLAGPAIAQVSGQGSSGQGSSGQGTSGQGTAGQGPLTGDQIERFIASMEDVRPMADEFEAAAAAGGGSGGAGAEPGSFMSGGVAQMRGMAIYDRLDDAVDGHGFDSPESWSAVGDRIFRAMMALRMQEEAPDMQGEIDAALAQIENDPNMTAEQKAAARASLQQMLGAVTAMSDAPPEDVAAVTPYAEEIEREFERE